MIELSNYCHLVQIICFRTYESHERTRVANVRESCYFPFTLYWIIDETWETCRILFLLLVCKTCFATYLEHIYYLQIYCLAKGCLCYHICKVFILEHYLCANLHCTQNCLHQKMAKNLHYCKVFCFLSVSLFHRNHISSYL